MAAWKGIVGKGFTAASFPAYVASLPPALWQPDRIVLHNTAVPTLAAWFDVGMARRLRGLEEFYRDTRRWSGGPHLFVAPDRIWVFTPLTLRGVHSPSWNGRAWGVEMVGDYETESLSGGKGKAVWNNAVLAMAVLCERGNLAPETDLYLHREDPKTDHACPGRKVTKEDAVTQVRAALLERALVRRQEIETPALIVVNDRWREAIPAVLRDGHVLAPLSRMRASLGEVGGSDLLTPAAAFFERRGAKIAWNGARKKLLVWVKTATVEAQ